MHVEHNEAALGYELLRYFRVFLRDVVKLPAKVLVPEIEALYRRYCARLKGARLTATFLMDILDAHERVEVPPIFRYVRTRVPAFLAQIWHLDPPLV